MGYNLVSLSESWRCLGRVLVGFSVQEKPIDELRKHLVKVGYRYWEETHNEGYNLFLR